MNISWLISMLAFAIITIVHPHRYVLDSLKQDLTPSPQEKPDQLLYPTKGRLLVPNPVRAPIRIQLDTTMFNDPIIAGVNGASTTTATNLNFVLKAMQITEVFYQKRLQVKPITNIIAPPTNCVDYAPSPTQISGYSNADLVIFVLYLTDASLTYGATGGSCQYVSGTPDSSSPDSTLTMGRPTFGRMIFNTYNLVDRETALTNRLFQSVTSTALHQTMHILGFDSTRYSSYLDPTLGYPYTSPTIAGTVNSNRPATTFLTTPYVLAWARDFFGCPSLAGMPLENQDGTGLGNGSHWERTAMYDEIMTATALGSAKYFSGLTFAILKDMGWYTVDDRFAGTSGYGYKKGCSFVTEACYGTSFSQFCTVSTTTSNNSYCDSNFLGKSICTDTSSMMTDGCGMYGEYFSCIDPTSQETSLQAYSFQIYSTASFCVDSTFGSVTLPSNLLSRCYSYTCTDTSIVFTIGSYSVTCLSSEGGTTKTLSALSGSLKCPDFTAFCTMSGKTCPNFCNQNGFCMNGVCHCNQGFYGPACSITTCSSGQYYDPGSGTCVTNCNSGYYANEFSNSCQLCKSPCSQCQRTPTYCLDCQPIIGGVAQFFYNNNCFDACPAGTYTLPNSTCVPCDTNCKTCSGASTTCTSCLSPNFLTSSSVCSTTCISPQNLYDIVNLKCQNICPPNLIQTSGNCQYCPTGQYREGIGCVSNCTLGSYPDSTTHACQGCDSTCYTCDGSYAENCTSCSNSGGNDTFLLHKMCWAICPKGFYANPTSFKCEVCPVELRCTACTYNASNSSAYCTMCEYGTFYQNTYQTCETTCLSTQYKNTWNNSCNQCDPACATCSGPTSYSCDSCHSSFYLLTNSTGGYCIPSCPSLGYILIGNQCQYCDPTCLTCNGTDPNNCYNCAANYYFSEGYCRYICPNATYPDSTTWQCLPCDSSCAYCFGSGINACTSCAEGLYLYNFTCTGSCPNGLTPNQWDVCFEPYFTHSIIVVLSMLIMLTL